MSWNRHRRPQDGGSAPATPGFIAIAPEWLIAYGAADAAPVIPAAESTLGSHPCAALSSAQVLPEWINHNPAVHAFASGSANPLTSCLSPGVHFTPVAYSPQSPHVIPRSRKARPICLDGISVSQPRGSLHPGSLLPTV